MEEVTRHFLISGHVQGVGFRAFTQKLAQRFRLCGWVRNLADGRVEALAQGSLENMVAFEAHMKSGTDRFRIEQVVSRDWPIDPKLSSFDVREDG